MMIKDFVEAGLRCPSCDSSSLRGAYHDWHTMNAFICMSCGLRWQEDNNDCGKILKNIKGRAKRDTMGERFIWTLVVAEFPHRPLLNPKSGDYQTRKQFVDEGLRPLESTARNQDE